MTYYYYFLLNALQSFKNTHRYKYRYRLKGLLYFPRYLLYFMPFTHFLQIWGFIWHPFSSFLKNFISEELLLACLTCRAARGKFPEVLFSEMTSFAFFYKRDIDLYIIFLGWVLFLGLYVIVLSNNIFYNYF